MDRRFTDTAKWKKPFIRALPPEYKLLWLYICDDCNKAGIWDVDIEIARIRTGCPKITEETALEWFGNKVKVIDNGTQWWMKGFCRAQYKKLNRECNMHKTAIEMLEEKGLWDDYLKENLPDPW